MKTLYAIILSLTLSVALCAQNSMLIQPDCFIPFTFTAAGNYPATATNNGPGDNRQKGCAAWTMMYQNTGMTSVTVTLQSGSSPTTTVTFGSFAGTISMGYTNGIVSDTGGSLQATNGTADISWVRVNVAATGTGTLTGVLYGFRNSSAAVSGGGGGGALPVGPVDCVQVYATATTLGSACSSISKIGNESLLDPFIQNYFGHAPQLLAVGSNTLDTGHRLAIGVECDSNSIECLWVVSLGGPGAFEADSYAANDGDTVNPITSFFSDNGKLATTIIGLNILPDHQAGGGAATSQAIKVGNMPSQWGDPISIQTGTGRNQFGDETDILIPSSAHIGALIQRASMQTGDLLRFVDNDNSIGITTFTGTGLNDASGEGIYRGLATATYCWIIDSTGTPDTYKWGTNGSCDNGATGVKIAGANADQSASGGFLIAFGASTGHTMGDKWSALATASTVLSSVENTGVFHPIGYKSADGSPGTTGNGFKNGLCVTAAGACVGGSPVIPSVTNFLKGNGGGGVSDSGVSTTDPSFVTVQATGHAFAALGTPGNGTYEYCSDCTVTSGIDDTCAASGGGAFAQRIAGAWKCNI